MERVVVARRKLLTVETDVFGFAAIEEVGDATVLDPGLDSGLDPVLKEGRGFNARKARVDRRLALRLGQLERRGNPPLQVAQQVTRGSDLGLALGLLRRRGGVDPDRRQALQVAHQELTVNERRRRVVAALEGRNASDFAIAVRRGVGQHQMPRLGDHGQLVADQGDAQRTRRARAPDDLAAVDRGAGQEATGEAVEVSFMEHGNRHRVAEGTAPPDLFDAAVGEAIESRAVEGVDDEALVVDRGGLRRLRGAAVPFVG